MAIRHYLAMTAQEIQPFPSFDTAWLAAHFSPYTPGLSNLPKALPPGSLLILDDITPIRRHDPQYILAQLEDAAEALELSAILLDFQRPNDPETAQLVSFLCERLPCPAAVSEAYGQDLTCPIFLPPLPPSESLSEQLLPYYNREVWLDLAPTAEVLTLTAQGAAADPIPMDALPQSSFLDETLHCRYHTVFLEDAVRFTLWRTQEDLDALLHEAEDTNITTTLRLLQDLPQPQNEQ